MQHRLMSDPACRACLSTRRTSIMHAARAVVIRAFFVQLHAAVVELAAGRNAEIKYSTVQNWYSGNEEGKGGIYNFVTKRGLCHGDSSKISWTQVGAQSGEACYWRDSAMLVGRSRAVIVSGHVFPIGGCSSCYPVISISCPRQIASLRVRCLCLHVDFRSMSKAYVVVQEHGAAHLSRLSRRWRQALPSPGSTPVWCSRGITAWVNSTAWL